MVAISLYRGNLHRAPQDTPRRWLMPTPRISLKDFRRLILRRSNSLSLLPSSSSAPAPAPAPAPLANPTLPDLPLLPPPPPEQSNVGGGDFGPIEIPNLCSDIIIHDAVAVATAELKAEDGGFSQLATLAAIDSSNDKENDGEKVAGADQIPASQADGVLNAIDEKVKRKTEVEEKLHILNEKKHNLVQALKQILNAEEELKRRSNVQANRPPLPLQVDVSNDSGSMTRHATPRAGSDANVTTDMEVGEGDDTLNHNPQPRQLFRMNSTSPSAESALRKPPFLQHNVASYPSRAAMVVAGSPSRFAPSGNQGQSSSMPTVSVSGTNYIASSPSPAASGGTSCFREARQPSPWN